MARTDTSSPENWYERWLNSTPLYTKIFTATAIGLFAVSCVADENFGQMIPSKIINEFQFFRFFISPFCEGSFMSLVLSVLWLNKIGKDLEVSLPNKHMFAVLLFKFSLLSNVLFVLVSYILSLNVGETLSHNLLDARAQGLLGTMITFLMVHPPASIPQIPIFPFFLLNGVSPKYLPWIVIGFVAIMNNTVPLDLFSSVALGYAELHGFLGTNRFRLCHNRFGDRIHNFIRTRLDREWALVPQYDPDRDGELGEVVEDEESRREKREKILKATLDRVKSQPPDLQGSGSDGQAQISTQV